MHSDTSRHDPALGALVNYESKRAATDSALKTYEDATALGDFRAAEELFGNANTAAFLARDAALKTPPTTTAGALALLRIVGPAISELGHDPDHASTLGNAIGAAVAILEQGGAVMTTKETTTTDEAPSDEELSSAFDHLIKMRMRLRGFAALMEETFEHTLYLEHEQMRGVVQLAADLSERMNECYEAAAPIVTGSDGLRFAAVVEPEKRA